MKKVLIVACDGLSKSGVPNVFMNIMRNMDKTEYSFDVLYFNKELPDYEEEIKQLGCRLVYSDLDEKKINKIGKLKAKRRTCKVIKAILKEYGPYDCVHSFKDLDSAYVLKAAYRCGVPCRIAHMAFTYFKTKNPIINIIENRERKLIDKFANYIISDSTKTSKNNIPFSKKNVVVRNFCDSRFKFNELDKDANPISLIQIGSYSFNKNQIFSILILKELIKQYPSSTLHFVGFKNPDDTSYFDKMNLEIKINGLENNVVFHNHDIETNDLFKKCHYLLFPSLSESFGIVPVEAQTSGLACFCSDTVTRENNCGGCTYLSLNEPQKWVEEIIKDFKQTNGEHRHFDLSGFSNDAIVEQYKLIYDNKYQK